MMKVIGLFFTIFPFLFFYNNDSPERGNSPVDKIQQEYYCYTTEIMQAAFLHDPSLQQRHEVFEEQLLHYLNNNESFEYREDYTLPVVVHIIHNSGTENIPDATVLQGIQDLNNAFANIGYYDPSTGVDTKIQFCLAKRDPDGNATSGINRIVSPLTDMVLENDDITVKDFSRWDPSAYINIWLVREITSLSAGSGVAGYAYFPASHGNPEDGIMMEARWFGNTSGESGVQIHEMGHYLGLYHTFEGGCSNNDCLLDGDRVCDTPPDQSTAAVPCNANPNSCNTDTDSGFATDQNDMFWNYMDYGDWDCYAAFTQGQADRMAFSIENIRNSLLNSSGCLDPCTSMITASFTVTNTVVNLGEAVNFNNTSTNATSYDWQIDGINFSNDINPAYQFNTEGFYEITLVAGNSDPNCVDEMSIIIEVVCPVEVAFQIDGINIGLGESVSATNVSVNATNYEWTINQSLVSMATDYSFTPSTIGVFEICLAADNGFCTENYCQYIIVSDPSDCETSFFETLGEVGIDEEGRVIIPSSDGNFYIAGVKDEKIFLLKLASNGLVIWARILDMFPSLSGNIFIWNLMEDSDGNLLGLGRIGSTGALHGFVFKYDPISQTLIWTKRRDNSISGMSPFDIHELAGENVYLITGQVNGCAYASLMRIDKNTGDPISSSRYSLMNCQTFSKSIIYNNSLYLTGRYNNAGGGSNRMRAAITKMDLNGNENWTRLYLVDPVFANARMYSVDMVIDNNEVVVITIGDDDGTSTTNIENYLHKTDIDGNILWAKKYNLLPGDTERARVLLSFSDGYIFGGYYISSTTGTEDIYIVKTNKEGEVIWAKSFDSGEDDRIEIEGMIENNGNILLTGKSGGDMLLLNILQDGTIDNGECSNVEDLQLNVFDMIDPYDGIHPFTEQSLSLGFIDGATTSEITDFPANLICGTNDCLEDCNNGIDDDGDGFVDCFDTECACEGECEDFYYDENCIENCTEAPLSVDFSIQKLWESEATVYNSGLAVVGDIDADGIPEAISFRSDGTGGAFDGLTGALKYEYPALNNSMAYAPAIANIDNDPFGEIIVWQDDEIRVLEHDGLIKWAIPLPFSTALRVAGVYDFNQDGVAEILFGNYIFSSIDGTLLAQGNGATGTNQDYSPAGLVVAADILDESDCGSSDCDGLEIIAGPNIYAVTINSYTDFSQNSINIVKTLPGYGDGYTSIADFDKDGELDVIVGGYQIAGNRKGVYVWNPKTETLTRPFWDYTNASYAIGRPNIADFDNDGELEIAVQVKAASGGKLKLLDNNMSELWNINTNDASGVTGCTAFDFDGDGEYEVLYRDQSQLRIIQGSTGSLLSSFPCTSGTVVEYPIVADVNNDGQSEIVCNCGGTSTVVNVARITVWGSADAPWMPARPVWNQHAYFNVNINDDLSIPIQQQEHHLLGDKLNTFLNQYSNPNSPLPDAIIQIDDLSCHLDSLVLIFTVCNQGDNILPFQTPIAIYNADPTSDVSAALISPIFTINQNLEPDSCLSFEVFIPNTSTSYTIVINDDASVNPIYNLATNFPVTSIAECDYTNNIASINFSYTPPTLNLDPDITICDNGIIILDAGEGFTIYRWQDGSNEQTFTAWGEGTYWIEVTDSCGGIQSDTISITIDPITEVNIGNDTTICAGDTLIFSVPDYAAYDWFPKNAIDCDTCSSISVFPDTSICYILVATNELGCISVDTVKIEIGGEATNDEMLTICQGDTIDFYGSLLSQNGNYQYIDSSGSCQITYNLALSVADTFAIFDTISICIGDTAIVFGEPIAGAGTYINDFTTSFGCDSTHFIELVLADTFAFFDTLTICAGDTAMVFGNEETMTDTYSQSLQTQNGCDSIYYILLNVLDTIITREDIIVCAGDSVLIFGQFETISGNYSQTNIGVNTCDSTHIISLIILSPLSITFDQIPTCFGQETGSLTANVTGGLPPYQYQWENSIINEMTVDGLSIGRYNLTVKDANGCELTTFALVDSIAETDIDILITDVSCFGENDGGIEIVNFGNWQISTDGQTFQSTTTLANMPAGEYILYILDENNCITQQDFIVGQPEELVLALPQDTTIVLGDSILIRPFTNGINVSYNWSPSVALNCDTCLQTQAQPTETILYTLSVTDTSDCSAIDDILIRVDEQRNVFIPNAFSPNGDDINDKFFIYSDDSVLSIKTLKIFDRWGEMVFGASNFSPNDSQFGWNGVFKGKLIGSGVFAYYVEVIFIDGITKVYKGDLTLVQ